MDKKFKVRAAIILSAILVLAIGLGITFQVNKNYSTASGSGNDTIADGVLEFQAVNGSGDRIKITSAPVNKDVTFHVAITTSAQSNTGEDYIIKMDNADFVIDGLKKDGDSIKLVSNGKTITVSIDFNDDKSAYDLIVTGWQSGVTLSFDLGGHKVSQIKTTATMTTNSAQLEADITAYGDITYTNKKTVNHSSLSISSDGTTVRDENGNELTGNLQYILRGDLDISNQSNAIINEKIKVYDTINIPYGINISDLDTLKSYLTVSGTGLTTDNVTYTVVQSDSGSNNIRKLKVSYTLDSANEITDFTCSNNYTIDLDISNLIKEYGTGIAKNATIQLVNDLNSDFVTQFDTITPEQSEVTTTIKKDEGPVYNYSKEISAVNGSTPTEYVKKGDTITYKMIINNTGIEAGTIDYRDYIPNNTEFVSASVDSGSSSGISNSLFAFDENTNSVSGSSTIAANGKLVLLMTVKVTSDMKGNIINTFFDKTVTIPEKLLEDYTINKTVDKNGFGASDANKSINYTITVTNTGAAAITDKSITDPLPNGITYVSTDVGTNTDVTVTYENGIVTIAGVNLQPGESKSFVVSGEVNGTVTGWIDNVATFIDKTDSEGINVEDPFEFGKYVNAIEDGERVTDPKSQIEANNGDSIEYTMQLQNVGSAYDLTTNNVIMVDTIPSTISFDQSNIYYTINKDDTHYTANITATGIDNGVTINWTIDSINGSTIFPKDTTITLHVFGTVNTGKISTTTTIKNTAKIESLKKESSAYIKVIPEKNLELEKYVYKIFDENGTLIYENTTEALETDQSKIPLIGENYTVVYRVKATNKSGDPVTELTFLEKPDNTNQIGLSTKYYDPTTGTVITGTNPTEDQSHIRINAYDGNNIYLGTFTSTRNYWWGNGQNITTKEYGTSDYEITYKKGVNSEGFILNEGETQTFEFSLVTTSKDFQKVTNVITNNNDVVQSETLYGKKTVNNLDKTVATTSKASVSQNQTYVDTLDILASKLDDNYLIYKVTFDTKGWLNDELEISDVLNSNFSYVTDGVEGYEALPIVAITNKVDQWTTVNLVKDDDNDATVDDSKDEYDVTANGNNMSIKIKPSAIRANNYQSSYTIYYLVKSNGTITVDNLSAKNVATINYNNQLLSDTATVNVIKEKSYPGISKKYIGAYGSSTQIESGNNPKLTDHANENSRLVWSFKVQNDTASNSKKIEDYTISDVLPDGYEYDNFYNDSTYIETKYYPSFTVVKSSGSITYSAYDGTYVEPTHSTTVIDGVTRNVISWHFNEEKYNLNPGEYIEFNISCKLPDNQAKSSVAINDVYLMVTGDYVTDSNDDVTTFEGQTALHAEDYVAVGSANVTTASKEVEVFEVGQDGYDYGSSTDQSDNKIKGVVGQDIKYTINIRNDSPSYVKNMVIIDRLPYVGDKYLSINTTDERASAFSIKYKEISSIQIVDADNQVVKTLADTDYQLDFSNYKEVISSERADWNKGQNEVTTWHSAYNSDSDVNMRIAFNDDIQLDTDQTIKVVFKANLPDASSIESSGEENIAWNNFSYNRTTENKITGETGDRLVAESGKVGVWVEKQETQITVNKVWEDNDNFHKIRPDSIKVQLMKRVAGSSDSYVAVDNPITLSGTGNTWGTVISKLPMYENGNLLEYTFIEVDENGSNVGNIDNYVTSDSIETVDSDGYKVITITNTEDTGKIKINKIVKNRDEDVTATTNETFYFVIKDTTTDKYVMHDENNKVSGYESLTLLRSSLSAIWQINPSNNANLEIDNLILGRAYQVIEVNESGVALTESNSKYIVAYNPATNIVADKDTTYNYTITNTLKLINVTVTKKWEDSSNKRGIRPSEITIQLYANGVAVEGKVITLSVNDAKNGNTDEWTYTFTDLRKTDDSGNEINYTVSEVTDLNLNYNVTVGNVINDGTVINQTITNTEKTGNITVTKQVMNYGNDITSTVNGKYYFVVKQGNDGYIANDGTIKSAIDTSCIYEIGTGSNGQAPYSKTVYNLTLGKTFTIIEVDENGNEINTNNVNYTISYENQNVTINNETMSANSKIINTINITEKTAEKIWIDSSNKHGVRPANAELQLYADGVAYGSPITITEQNYDTDSNKWTYTFKNLKKYKDDGITEIIYTIKENNLDVHYTKEENGLTVTNTEKTGSITITKQVLNNTDDITASTERTFYFIVEQFTDNVSNGYITSIGDLVSDKSNAIIAIKTGANGDNNFSKTISGLAIEKSYKVTEVNADGQETNTENSDYIVAYDSNQTMSLTGSITSGTTVVKNTLDTVNVVVNKIWDDNNNINGFRPDFIKVQLYADGVEQGDKVELKDVDGKWTFTWDNLKKYRDNGTDLVVYTVKEFDKDGNESISNYVQMPQSVSSVDNTTTITITNKESLGGLTISKFILNSAGNALENIPDEFKGPYYVTVKRKDTGKYIDADGNESVAVKTITLNAKESVTITNIPLTTYIVTETDISGIPKSEDEQFTSRFEISYSNNSQEVTISNSSDAVGIVINNKIIEKTKLDVIKSWIDNDNLHKLRPESIEVKLYTIDSNGNKIDTNISKIVSAPEDNKSANEWTVTFDNLDKYDANGNKIQYTADEVVVPTNYTKTTKLNSNVVGTTNDSVTITNEEVSKDLVVTKKYLNNDGTDITATSEVTFNFIVEQLNNGTSEGFVNENGAVSSEKTIFSITTGPNVNNNFSKNILGLTRNREYKVIETDSNGNEITTNNSNFDVSYTNQVNTITDSNANTTITNKLKSTSLNIVKQWIDNEDHGLRNDIVVTLKADGNIYGTYTLTQANNWRVSINNLPKYRNNGVDEIVYTVEEDASTIANYNQGTIEKVDGDTITITNTEVTGTINITKQLLNNNNEVIENISSTLADKLYYVTVQTIAIKANQMKTLTNVALGKYTIKETNATGDSIGNSFNTVDSDGNSITLNVGYESNEFTLTKENSTNSTIVKNKITDSTSVTVTKIWNDKDKNLEHRPISIDVTLYANSEIAKDISGNQMKVTLTDSDKVDDYNWKHTFSNLPKYDANGAIIKYTIAEDNVQYAEGEELLYSSEVDQNKLTITNTPSENNEKVSITIKKNWSGNDYEAQHRPNLVIFIVVRADTNQEVTRIGLRPEKDWEYTRNNLPKYNENLYEIQYKVYELINNPEGMRFYDVSNAILLNGESVIPAVETSENTFEVTNKFKVPDDKININVQKVWTNLLDNYGDTIPDEIKINVIGTVGNNIVISNKYTIDKATYENTKTQWNYAIKDLPKYDSETGEEISYKVTEDSINNFELVNTIENYVGDEKSVVFENKQLTGSLQISKTVINSNGTDISGTVKQRYYFTITYEEAGTKYYVDLDGKLQKSMTVLSIATGSSKAAEIKNLLLNKTYVVTETDASGNTLTENGDYTITNGTSSVILTKDNNSANVTIINTLKSKKISITKTWDDVNDKYGKRPTKLGFILYKTVEYVTTSDKFVVNIDDCKVEGNTWTYEIDNLPRKDDYGRTITYNIVEDQNTLEWYYLTNESAVKNSDSEEYSFTNKEIVGNYSLQLLKVDENDFTVPGMKFKVDDKEYETDSNGKIIIIDRKEIYDNSAEHVTIEEISNTSSENKKYVKLAENLDLYIAKQRVKNDCKVTGISFNGVVYSTKIEKDVLLENGAKAKIKASVTDNDITVTIINVEQKPDLSLQKFITKINDTEITSQTPNFTTRADGTYAYNSSNEVLEVEDNDIVKYTIRVYNEGNIHQFAELIEDEIPQGLEFIEDNEINLANGWKLVEGSKVQTSILSKENGENNILNPFIPENMTEPYSKDIQLVLKVVEPENSDRIVTNNAQIMKETDKDVESVKDIDSNAGIWIDGEDDQDSRSIKVKYFDLSLDKYISKVTTISEGKETTKEIENNDELLKLDLKSSEIQNTIIKVEYTINVKNEGEIAGYAKEISEYIPEGFKFVKEDNVNWYEKDNKIVTNALENTILQPGQIEKVKIILTWINSSDNIGMKTNAAEISEDFNESNTPDIDSTPGNKDLSEDDMSTATLMITVRTGSLVNGIAIASSILIILGIAITVVLKLRKRRV